MVEIWANVFLETCF